MNEQQKNKIREEFEKENIPDYKDGNILMKNIADWWLSKIDELLKSQEHKLREELVEKIEKLDTELLTQSNGYRIKVEVLSIIKSE